jgi:hypothetical protein
MQNAGAVGADLQTGAEFAQFPRLFIDVDVDVPPDQRQRRREPADAAADDDEMPLSLHAGSPAALRLKSTKISSPLRIT